jgi:hypothetical protein
MISVVLLRQFGEEKKYVVAYSKVRFIARRQELTDYENSRRCLCYELNEVLQNKKEKLFSCK